MKLKDILSPAFHLPETEVGICRSEKTDPALSQTGGATTPNGIPWGKRSFTPEQVKTIFECISPPYSDASNLQF